jgi:hypothetical protein
MIYIDSKFIRILGLQILKYVENVH